MGRYIIIGAGRNAPPPWLVIAGIVGSGGLGSAIYDAVRTLSIGKSIDAGIAIVILTMILDRISEGAVKDDREAR